MHQRKLPYWCTLVWNSHQLIPNKAYSPQGRLLRKRQDSVFERDYVGTPLHPRPSLEGEIYTSRCKPSSYCRLSSTSCTLGARRQDWVLGTMVFALHRVAQCQDTRWICRKRPRHSYSDAGLIMRASRRINCGAWTHSNSFLQNKIFNQVRFAVCA